jgi:ubiquitin C-terminal hydrolase
LKLYFLIKIIIGSGTSKYNLYAVSNHSGSLDFGHYFAYIKLKDSWYEFNDSFISKCYTFNNNSSTAYVLFYRREDV